MKTLLKIYIFTSIFCQIFAQKTEQHSKIKGINHVSISVTNLENSINFYKNAIGLEVVNQFQIKQQIAAEKLAKIKHQNRKIAILKSPNGQIELVQFDKVSPTAQSVMPIQGAGITHVCYQSPHTNLIYEKSKNLGAKIVSRGTSGVDRGYGIKYAYIRDTDNIMFENEQFDKPKFTENNWIGHVAIVTPDIDGLVKFYSQLLNNQPINRIDNIKNNPKLDDIANLDSLKLRGAWFKVGNMLLEIWQFDNPELIANKTPISYSEIGYQKIVFEVENLENLYKKLSEKGINFLSKPVNDNEMKEVFLRDPDGNLLLLQQLKLNDKRSVDKLKKLD
jgi:catechol 2,3-dioxygenase-like lactoylglutathione lyase family enzyme